MKLQARLARIETSVENRRGRRHRLILEVEATVAGSNSNVVKVHDISDTGLLIATDTKLDVGEQIEVNLPQAGSRLAEVVWTSGKFLGCRFNEELTQGAISAARLGGKFTPQGPKALVDKTEIIEAEAYEYYAAELPGKLSLQMQLWSIIGSTILAWCILSALALWLMS